MKMLSIILLTSVLCFGAGDSDAQDANIGWAGVRVDDGARFSLGYGKDLGVGFKGGHFWVLTGTNVGAESSWDIAEISLLFTAFDKLHFGPVAGPNVDWVDAPPADGLAYLSGAGGGLVCYDLWADGGLWGYGKFKYTFEADNLYRDGWATGGGLYIRF